MVAFFLQVCRWLLAAGQSREGTGPSRCIYTWLRHVLKSLPAAQTADEMNKLLLWNFHAATLADFLALFQKDTGINISNTSILFEHRILKFVQCNQ